MAEDRDNQENQDRKSDKQTILGVNENLEAMLCYVLGWVTGLAFLLLEKDNKFVRFHALQSLVTFLALHIVTIVLDKIPYLGMFAMLIALFGLVLWIVLMVKTYKGERFKLPVIGDFVEKQLGD